MFPGSNCAHLQQYGKFVLQFFARLFSEKSLCEEGPHNTCPCLQSLSLCDFILQMRVSMGIQYICHSKKNNYIFRIWSRQLCRRHFRQMKKRDHRKLTSTIHNHFYNSSVFKMSFCFVMCFVLHQQALQPQKNALTKLQ